MFFSCFFHVYLVQLLKTCFYKYVSQLPVVMTIASNSTHGSQDYPSQIFTRKPPPTKRRWCTCAAQAACGEQKRTNHKRFRLLRIPGQPVQVSAVVPLVLPLLLIWDDMGLSQNVDPEHHMVLVMNFALNKGMFPVTCGASPTAIFADIFLFGWLKHHVC